MPVHDWTRVDAGLFHDFHQVWTVALRNALNSGCLPPDYYALVDQNIRGPIPDVLTLKAASDDEPRHHAPGVATSTAPPRARLIRRNEVDLYAARANRISVRHRHGDVVAVIEIVSPGNKASRSEFRRFVEKSAELLRQGIHLLVIDLFPPGKRDPFGIHKAIWDEFMDEDFEVLPGKPLLVVSYDAGPVRTAYIEPIGVGDSLPDIPLFLEPEYYVPAPLESTYQAGWEVFPPPLRNLLESDPTKATNKP